MTKTILHLTHTDIPFDARILKQMLALRALENVKIYGCGVSHKSNECKTANNTNDLNIFTLDLISKKLTVFWKPILYSLNLIELIIRVGFVLYRTKPDIVHAHDTLAMFVAYVFSYVFKYSLIYDAHELESDKNGQGPILSKATLLLEKIAWKRIDFFITVSPSILNWYQKKLGNKQSEIILNAPALTGHNVDTFPSNYLRKKYNINDTARIFIHIGIMGVGRGIPLYIDTFNRLDEEYQLVFLGDGPLVESIKLAANYEKNIHWHESVDHSSVVDIASSANVGLCMIEPVSKSDEYSLPNKLFEFIFARLPVISSRLPDIEHLVVNRNLGTVSDNNEEQLIKTITTFDFDDISVNDKNIYDLTWQHQSDKLVDIYVKYFS